MALKPDIAVAPDVLDFGEVVVDYTDSQILSVINAGRVELEVSELSISDNTDGVFTITQAGAVTVEEERPSASRSPSPPPRSSTTRARSPS